MIPIVETRFTSKHEEIFVEKFVCARCGHRDTAYVTAQAKGEASALYGLGEDSAADDARHRAASNAVRNSTLLIELARCPACKTSARRDFVKQSIGVGALILAVPSALSCVLFFTGAHNPGFLVGLAAFLSTAASAWHLNQRWLRWKRGTQPRALVFASRLPMDTVMSSARAFFEPGAQRVRLAQRAGISELLLERFAKQARREDRERKAEEERKLRAENERLRAENERLRSAS